VNATAADDPDAGRLTGLLHAMRAVHGGDLSARAPMPTPMSMPATRAEVDRAQLEEVAELYVLFNAIAERTQALEHELARSRRAPTAEETPTILVLEADGGPAADGPMRLAARAALSGLDGGWDDSAVRRVDSAEAVYLAVAGHQVKVVCALLDARAGRNVLHSVVAALDACAPEVPVLCFAPNDDPAAQDQAVAAKSGRDHAEIVRSAGQAVERLTAHWRTAVHGDVDSPARLEDAGRNHIRFDGEKVLVVDDDVRNVFAMVSALELYGLTTLTADSGVEGIELLVRNPDVSVVLMDLMMPGLDGYATTTRIRSYPQFATLPIIAVTARAAQGDRERSLAAGTDEHVTKPVDMDHLLMLISRLIKR
jgi:CheY-like chemotaxis protein